MKRDHIVLKIENTLLGHKFWGVGTSLALMLLGIWGWKKVK